MANIPGLSFVPANDEEGEIIEYPTFGKDTLKVSQAHRFGNSRPREDFDKCGTIYEGTFGDVYMCRDKRNKQIYALKKIKFKEEMMNNGIPSSFINEFCVLKVLKHDNIVNCYGLVSGKNVESNLFILDYCVTSLNELIEKKREEIYERDVVKYIMKQFFDGLSYIHESLVIHRNISCRNLLFTENGTLKICGFRTARFLDPENMPPVMTELAYRAPELLLKAKYGQAADMWSAGCVLAHLLLKKPLFTGDSENEMLKSIFSILGTPSETIWPGFNEIVQKGTQEEKVIRDEQPYSDVKNIFNGVPAPSSQIVQDLIIYYPDARWTARYVMKSHYIVDIPHECSPEKMKMVLQRCLSASELLNEPMQVDS